MPACCRAGRCGQETRSGSNNSRNRACSFHQGSRHTSEESSRETTTSRPGLPAGSHPGSRPYVCLPGGRTRTPKGTSIVNQHHTIRLSSWARLIGLALLLGVGVLASLGLTSKTAHAQPATTITVSTCDESHLSSAIGGTSAGAGYGGGLLNDAGTVSISTSTFANNSAIGGGGLINFSGTVSIGGSIVANNTGGNCSGGTSDQGYNLSSDSSCGFTGTGSLQNTDPKLDPGGLQNNGGPTQTIALLATSPAIDHIPAANCPATDQRAHPRPDGASS